MMHYMKRISRVVVLTMVLVFSGLLVLNSGFMTEDAEAIRAHQNDRTHVHLLKYYEGISNGNPYHRWEWRYYWHTNYR